MCEIQTLCTKPNVGFVVQCKDCKLITVVFEMVSVTRTVKEFHQLLADAHACYDHYSGQIIDGNFRDIPFWQLTPNICLVLSLNDILNLMELLEISKTKLTQSSLIGTLSLN